MTTPTPDAERSATDSAVHPGVWVRFANGDRRLTSEEIADVIEQLQAALVKTRAVEQAEQKPTQAAAADYYATVGEPPC